MSWHSFRPYVTAAERRAKAVKQAAKLFIKGRKLSPVQIKGRDIARTFWGKAWCSHLESFSDYENRLSRGRTYVRSGSVIDLQIAPGKITAKVMGSSLYEINLAIAPPDESRWQAIKDECAGKIDSLVELLQGRLSSAVLRIITDRDKGLFPKPSEIEKTCSCPDWADLCKHLAAVLHGVGSRLDQEPELLFVLRGVDHLELIGSATETGGMAQAGLVGRFRYRRSFRNRDRRGRACAATPSDAGEQKEEDWHAKTATEPEEVSAQESREERVILLGSDVS